MKRRSILALAALSLALPSAANAQGLPEFLEVVGAGIGEGVAQSAAMIAASMEEELGVTLSVTDMRMEAGKALTLTVTASNPRLTDTPVTFELKLPERLSCEQGNKWEAVLPPAQAREDGTTEPSVTAFERTIALAAGGVSEKAEILCEMNMGTRFYRAQQELELCVADVAVSAAVEGAKDHRVEPGDTFAWRIEVTNAGSAEKDVELSMILPAGVTLAGELPEGFALSGSRLTGSVCAQRAQVDDAGAAASLAVIALPMQVNRDALEGDKDASRLISGTLYADGERVPLPRVQICAPRISAQLVAQDHALEAGEETILRVVVVNEGLVGAQMTLSCALPEGLELIAGDKKEKEAKEEKKEKGKEKEEKTAVPSAKDGGAGADGVPVMADGAQEAENIMTEENGTIIFNWYMGAAQETEDGVVAATQVFELPVRSAKEKKDIQEELVGAAFTYSVNGGDQQLGQAEVLRLYTPSFLGVTHSEWGGVFWACVLMMITVSCLYGAVRAGREKDEYFCCE